MKKYVGSVLEKEGNYGKYLTVSLSEDDVHLLNNNLVLSDKNGKSYVNLVISERKEESKKEWVSHNLYIREPKAPQTTAPQEVEEEIIIPGEEEMF